MHEGTQVGARMQRNLNQPLGGNEMPRFGGPATMMRLPAVVDAAGRSTLST